MLCDSAYGGTKWYGLKEDFFILQRHKHTYKFIHSTNLHTDLFRFSLQMVTNLWFMVQNHMDTPYISVTTVCVTSVRGT